MEQSLETLKWKSFAMTLASSMDSHQLTHPNKMEWWRGRIEPWSLLQELCWMIMASHKDFGRKLSTPHAMHPTESISTASWKRHPMSFSLGGSQHLLLPGVWMQMLHIQEKEAPRQV